MHWRLNAGAHLPGCLAKAFILRCLAGRVDSAPTHQIQVDS